MKTLLFAVFLLGSATALALSTVPAAAQAQQIPVRQNDVIVANSVPSPAASATPAAPSHAGAPAWLKTFDPCAGSLELLNKIGAATPCVFVLGEAAATAQYVSANLPVNTQIEFMGHTVNLSNGSHAFGYPASLVYVGVGPRSEIVITPPSFVQVNSGNHGTLVAGASNMKFEYKQLVYVNLGKFPLVGLDLAYKAPTGSTGLQGAGPEYTVNPILTQALPHHFGLTLAIPVTNFTVPCPTCASTSRGWSITPLLVPFWEPQGGTLLALVFQHSFNPNVTPIALTASQLVGRHFSVTLTVGGLNYTSSTSGPISGLVSVTSTTYPSLFSVGMNYLFGRSDLPPALQH
jgi:hypothetical protein